MKPGDLEHIKPLNRALLAAWGPGGDPNRHHPALRAYLRARSALAPSYRMFEIANHRVFQVDGGLLVPYDAHGLLVVFRLGPEHAQVVFERKFSHGTVFTDRRIFELAGMQGKPVDLERRIYALDTSAVDAVQVHRLRDLASTLERINASGSRHEVVYLMRFLVARLCTSSYNRLTGAKNLQPEIMRVRAALLVFLQGPFAVRLGLPTRVLVRHISGLVTQLAHQALHLGQGEEAFDEGLLGRFLEEGIAAFGDHDRIQDHRRAIDLVKGFGDGIDQDHIGNHADFYGVDGDIVEQAQNLPFYDGRSDFLNIVYFAGILNGDGRNGRHAEDAVGLECLEIGLNAGTARRIRAGDGQRRAHRHGPPAIKMSCVPRGGGTARQTVICGA